MGTAPKTDPTQSVPEVPPAPARVVEEEDELEEDVAEDLATEESEA